MHLRVAYLHDNLIADPATLLALGSSPSLQILTMHSTPVSQSSGYRHRCVNLLWSLVALDHHVVSDEEIIEGAVFPGRFKAQAPCTHLNTYIPSIDVRIPLTFVQIAGAHPDKLCILFLLAVAFNYCRVGPYLTR
jgi:hypothetical protein